MRSTTTPLRIVYEVRTVRVSSRQPQLIYIMCVSHHLGTNTHQHTLTHRYVFPNKIQHNYNNFIEHNIQAYWSGVFFLCCVKCAQSQILLCTKIMCDENALYAVFVVVVVVGPYKTQCTMHDMMHCIASAEQYSEYVINFVQIVRYIHTYCEGAGESRKMIICSQHSNILVFITNHIYSIPDSLYWWMMMRNATALRL